PSKRTASGEGDSYKGGPPGGDNDTAPAGHLGLAGRNTPDCAPLTCTPPKVLVHGDPLTCSGSGSRSPVCKCRGWRILPRLPRPHRTAYRRSPQTKSPPQPP